MVVWAAAAVPLLWCSAEPIGHMCHVQKQPIAKVSQLTGLPSDAGVGPGCREWAISVVVVVTGVGMVVQLVLQLCGECRLHCGPNDECTTGLAHTLASKISVRGGV